MHERDDTTPLRLSAGERWAREELGRLREAGWRPGAQVTFIRAAQARANATRSARPRLARQELVWCGAGALAWAVLARRSPTGVFARRRRQGLVWWTGTALMLDWHLGMLETPAGEPVGLHGADALTLLRAWLVPAVADAADPRLVLLGALSDLGDGALARATRTTRLGRDLEGLADVCFGLAALAGAVRAGHVSPWAARLERGRLLAGIVYATGTYLVAGRAPDPALLRSGRDSAPLRAAALVVAGVGHRGVADRLLTLSSAVALAHTLRARGRTRAVRLSPKA
ncbi:MAG TPA: hypothetical protein VFN48_03185 [Solirubrobacteraceae bacterium]|nr:hypothetical protein [Solirubrobacteraceae bacterium]